MFSEVFMTIAESDKIMKSVKSVFFIGVGGVSMSSLALFTLKMGYKAGGSDRSESETTKRLSDAGVSVFYGHRAKNTEGYDAIVYTAAIKSDNPELLSAKERKLPCFTRAEYLGWLMSKYEKRIGVAGTHGKSTVTSMLGEIFIEAEADPTIMVGAEMRNLNSSYRLGSDSFFIFEACEYTDSFLSFCPTTAVVTNIEYDHADYFKDMAQLEESFAKYMKLADTVCACADDKNLTETLKTASVKAVTFAIDSEDADFRAENIVYGDGGCASFDLLHEGKPLSRITLSVPGRHNVLNALAAAAAAYVNGISAEAIAKGLSLFKGAKRRFEYKGRTAGGADVYDEYAHHPSEISAAIDTARKLDKRVVCVFQPHTFSRTLALLDGFIDSFNRADEAVFAEIYPAREVNPGNVTSELISCKVKNARYIPDFDGIVKYINESCGKDDLVLVIGAGSITAVADMLTSSK